MNFTIVLSMLLFCSLILAQYDVNVPEKERTSETQSCFSDLCDFLKEFVSTGIFAAPVPGIYYFTFFYNAGGSQEVFLILMKNNQDVVSTADRKTSHDDADNGGNAVFLQLQQGDQVYMRLGANTHVWGDNFITTFSGFLVSQV
ncbi:complement C1q tumor necrosis factor-related protein 3-like [Morone saxatilis]|uniref:complement C1q tumor necrosis factor-related protein 3-like n=1 Tax=Morone saxatilis TaxID=34816 RepID=UPI0015E23617|nr:complement C1q tumor necrosis factor-related protein 3-like [Morone saxatilis]